MESVRYSPAKKNGRFNTPNTLISSNDFRQVPRWCYQTAFSFLEGAINW